MIPQNYDPVEKNTCTVFIILSKLLNFCFLLFNLKAQLKYNLQMLMGLINKTHCRCMVFCVIKEGRRIQHNLIVKIIRQMFKHYKMIYSFMWTITKKCSKSHYFTFSVEFHNFKMNFVHHIEKK